MKMKDSLVKKHHLLYDSRTFVLTRDMQSSANFAKMFEPKSLPGGSNLNFPSRDHISNRRQNNVDFMTCS